MNVSRRNTRRLPVPIASSSAATATTAPTTTTTTTTTPTSTTTAAPTTPPPTLPPASEPPVPDLVERGDEGADVEQIQRRLEELRYWVGPVDGIFGHLTEQAVFAFQKINGLTIDGIVGPGVREALDDPAPPAPRSTTGTAWEVDKARQIVMMVRGGEALWIWNTSTGTEEPYTHGGRQLIADTPPGRFTFDWHVDGWRDGALGPLYRPKYFHPDGIAIHGYGSVPPYPASHGCVRVTIPAMDYIWNADLAPLGTPVWVYGVMPR